MDKLLRLGIIGCSKHMYDFLYDRTKFLPIKLISVCDKNEDRIHLFTSRYNVPSQYTDFKQMINSEHLDAVICSAAPDVHYQVAQYGMEHGVHVLVEKAPCSNMNQLLELLEIQRRTGIYTVATFNRRYTTAYGIAKKLVDRPEFGNIYMYQAKYHAAPYASEEAFVIGHLIHHLDLARFFLGEIRIVDAYRFYLNDHKVGFNITFKSSKGTIGNLQSASIQHGNFPMERVELVGDGRNVIVDNIRRVEYNRPGADREKDRDYALPDGEDTIVWNPTLGNSSSFSYYGYEHELHDFAEHVLAGKPPNLNLEDTVGTMALLDELREFI